MMEKVRNRMIGVWVAICGLLAPTVALADADPVDYSDLASVVSAMTSQINNTTILSVIVGSITISIGFVFLFWAIRYVWRRFRRSSQGRGMTP